LLAGCVSDRFADLRKFEKEANGRFLAVSGFAVHVPGVDDFETKYSWKTDAFVIPGTSDYFGCEEERDFNRRAEEFAKRYNQRLLRKMKPIQPSETTRGK
jgi:hypothetical protein